MPKVPRETFLGLNTKAEEEGLPLAYATTCQNLRLNTGRPKPRRGRDRVLRAGDNQSALDLNGSTQDVLVSAPTTAWTLKRYWTFRMIIEPDTVSGTQYLVGWSNTTRPFILYLNGSTLTWTVVDTGDTAVTLTSTAAITTAATGIQLERRGTTLTMYVNGLAASGDTDTMADLDCKVPTGNLFFGSDQTANYFNGSIEGPELMDGCHLTNEPLVRNGDPITCRAWYDLKSQGNSIVRDLSRFRNHGETQNAPSEVTTLARAHRPIRGLRPYVARGGRKRIFFIAHNLPYIAEVT
ncbi:MAG: LamG domain-containing protein [bacterium]|nr:LamG domain-containing protein [bacterium]